MNPEEKLLLQRNLKVAEENNKILRKMDRRSRLAMLWGFIKIAVVVVPLIIGYLYLEPYFKGLADEFTNLQSVLKF